MKKMDWTRWRALLGKYKFVLLIFLLGFIFMLWPSGQNAKQTERKEYISAEDGEFNLEQQEKKLEELLGKIKGVGNVKVMLSLAGSGESILAKDSDLRYSGAVTAPDSYEKQTQTVMTSQGSGNESVVVTKRIYPAYRGALIVCTGGEDAAVRLAVTEAVSVLTGLGSDRISICKWGEE